MSDDKRVWMYKGREAKIFNSIEDVPDGEGWKDAPYDAETTPETEKPKRGKIKLPVEPDVTEATDGNSN